MYKFITSARKTENLPIGFDRDRERRKRELTNNKNGKGKYHVTITLDDIFGFCENQVKSTYSLGYKLTLTRNSDNAVSNKGKATKNAKSKINSIDWYVRNYTPSLAQEKLLMDQIVKKMPTEILDIKWSVFMKEVITQKLWNFDLGTQEGLNVPIWITVGFQQSDRQHDQNLNNDNFYRPPVVSAQSIIGTKKNPDSANLLFFNDDDYSQGYRQIKEAFGALTKDDVLEPYISDHDFISSNDGNIIAYILYVFDIRYQKSFESAQSKKVEFKIDGAIPAGTYGYSLVLRKKK